MATKKVNIDIVAKDKSKQALRSVQGNLDGVKKAVFNVRNALAGLGAGLVIRNLVNTGKELENLQVRLKFLLKDTNEGAKAFDNMVKFASKVPFSLEEIQSGSGILATVTDNADDLQKMLEITGNVAAVTGLDFRTASEQIQRSFSAGIGAADLFREKGVRNMLGFKAGATVSIEETVEAFETVFGKKGRFGNATDELADTFAGTLSMINDKFFSFKKDILEAGFFPELKKQFGDLDKFLEENSSTIEDIAETLGKGLANAVVTLSESIKFIADNFKLLKAAVGGFIAFKLANTFLKIASAARQFFLTLTGITALTGPRGLGLVATAIGTMTTAALLLPDPLEKSFEEFKKLTKPELKNKINNITDEIKKLEEENKKLEESLKEMTPELELPELDNFDDLKDFKDEIVQIPNLFDGATDSMLRNSETISKLKAELELLNQILDSNVASAVELGHFPNLEDNPLTNGTIVKGANQSDEATKKLIETHGVLDGDFKALVGSGETYLGFLADLKKAYEQTGQSLQEFLDKEQGLKMMNEEGIFDDDQLDPSRFESFKIGFKEAMKEATNSIEVFKEIGEKSFGELKNVLADFVMTGKLNFQDFARTITRMVIEALIGSAIQSALAKATELFKMKSIREALINVYTAGTRAFAQGGVLGPFLAAGVIASGLALVSKIKGFEKGGTARANQPALVGEKGPEIIMPRRDMEVIPNKKISGMGGTVNVNFTINAVDTRGFRSLLNNEKGTIVNIINQAVTDKGRPVLV
jgi:hypothetical protein